MGTFARALVIALLFPSTAVFAQRLPATITPQNYDLAFTIDLAHARFEGTETIRVMVGEPTATIVLNALDLTITDVTVGTGDAMQHATVALDPDAQTATFTVPQPLAKGATDIHARFAGELNDQLRGLYLSKANNRSYAVTQFESTDARRAFPCWDEPSYKATFALTVTLDRGDTAISNGRPMSNVAGPGRTQHTITFSTTPRMSTYLVALAVGDFQCVEGGADNVPIRICATPDKKDLTRIALDAAQQILHFYDNYYAIKYPFMKLDVVAVPDFAAGAMENTGAIFYRETDLLADAKTASVDTRKRVWSVLAHEMAHQWFGDLVTMQWWDDIWLNEGFATWMANKPLAALHPDWNMDLDEAIETQHALELDSLQATRPVHVDVTKPSEIDEAFDSITYEKGAAVLRMVERYVGAEAFRRGINGYLQTHAYKNATSEDFWKAIAAVSNAPVERILPTFVNQPGVPLISVALSCPQTSGTLVTLSQRRLTIDRAASVSGRSLWQVPVCYEDAARKQAPNATAAPPSCVVLDEPRREYPLADAGCQPWVFANVDARGYYRTEYAPALLQAIAPNVQARLTPPERLSIVDDEWAMVRAGIHDISSYLTLAAGYGHEHAAGVLDEITDRLQFVADYLTTAQTRPAFERFVGSLWRPLYDEIGLNAAPTDGDDRRALRAEVVSTLGLIANDPAVVSASRAAIDRALAGGAALEPTVAGAIVRTAAAHGDAKLFDALASAAERSASPEEQYRYLNALAEFRDPALIDRGLQRVLSSAMRTQDAALYLAGFFRNPAARERAWTFVKEHWAALQPKIAIFGGDTSIAASMGNFCSADDRRDVAAFFNAHPLPAATRTLEQALERIDNCVTLQRTQTDVVGKWLEAR